MMTVSKRRRNWTQENASQEYLRSVQNLCVMRLNILRAHRTYTRVVALYLSRTVRAGGRKRYSNKRNKFWLSKWRNYIFIIQKICVERETAIEWKTGATERERERKKWKQIKYVVWVKPEITITTTMPTTMKHINDNTVVTRKKKKRILSKQRRNEARDKIERQCSGSGARNTNSLWKVSDQWQAKWIENLNSLHPSYSYAIVLSVMSTCCTL